MRAQLHNLLNVRVVILCTLALCLLYSVAASSSPQRDEPTRDLWDTAFDAKRNQPRRVGSKVGARGYRVTTPGVSPDGVTGDTVVGVTIWRLRPARPADDGERMSVIHEAAGTEDWIPERVRSGGSFAEGDRVRLSIEAAREGYLYVINREEFVDGTYSDPEMIFPTTRTRHGDNRVQPGLLVDIPAQDDRPPYLTLKRGRANQSAEVLSFIITKTPLEGVQISENPLRLSVAQVLSWEKSWGGPLGRLELDGGAGQPWTKSEREASASAARLLSRDAPTPQTIYYNPVIKYDAPFLLAVRLNYARPRPRP